MRSAIVVSTARSPIGKAYRGAFNDTQAQALGGHVIAEAARRAGIDPAEVEDVVMGAAVQQGSQGYNVARQSALRAGIPVSVPAMSVDRQCASGLMAIATAAKQIVHDGMTKAIGGGLESISLVQNEFRNVFRQRDPELLDRLPQIYMTMIETAEVVCERYGISRDAQDAYALQSQRRTAEAQVKGLFDAEIAPLATSMTVVDKASGAKMQKSVTLSQDEGARPDTTLEGLAALKPVLTGGQRIALGRFITAGNASQLSDGAAAVVLMEEREVSRRGFKPLGILSRHGRGGL